MRGRMRENHQQQSLDTLPVGETFHALLGIQSESVQELSRVGVIPIGIDRVARTADASRWFPVCTSACLPSNSRSPA